MSKDGLTFKDEQKIKALQDKIEQGKKEQMMLKKRIQDIKLNQEKDSKQKTHLQEVVENLGSKGTSKTIKDCSQIPNSLNKTSYNAYYDNGFQKEYNKLQWLKQPILELSSKRNSIS